jgi:hypothetical protein
MPQFQLIQLLGCWQVIMEGPEDKHETAQKRLVLCMQEPFVRDRANLHRLMMEKKKWEGKITDEQMAEWDKCYHCGMRLPLTVDCKVANTWFDAK